MRQHRRERQRAHDAGRNAPVVADDEVEPEAQERDDMLHDATWACCADSPATRSRPRTRTASSDTAVSSARIAGSAASSPGHVAPAPSAPQNTPNVVNRSPTANLRVFSGARATAPATATTTKAAPAAAAARATPASLVAPNVMTMKATSRPSRNTPLNATVNAYQSIPPRRSAPARRASSRSRA